MPYKKIRRLIMGGIVLCLLAAFLFGFWRVNREYPPAERLVYRAGDTFTIEEAGLEITAMGSELLTIPQLKERYPDISLAPIAEGDGESVPDEEKRILMAEIQMRPLTDSAGISYLQTCGAQSGAWRHSMSRQLYVQINTGDPDEEGVYHLILPYEMYAFQFLKKDWAAIDDRPFELVFSLYPSLKIWELET
ncbi:MAG: hypothetical protein HFJ80_05185 [Clostridiales bacterium]|nr:hypothetical protein [Clostridiales bacterium]